MNNIHEAEIIESILEVENALINEEFSKVGSESRNSLLSGEEIKKILAEYGGKVTSSPKENLLKYLMSMGNFGEIANSWIADVDLYIDGKHSDLTLKLAIQTDPKGHFIACIEDLHIL